MTGGARTCPKEREHGRMAQYFVHDHQQLPDLTERRICHDQWRCLTCFEQVSFPVDCAIPVVARLALLVAAMLPGAFQIPVADLVGMGMRVTIGHPEDRWVPQQSAYAWRVWGAGPYMVDLVHTPGQQDWARLGRPRPAGTRVEAMEMGA